MLYTKHGLWTVVSFALCLVVSALLVVVPVTALAFEVKGVRSGMAYHEVVTKLERQGSGFSDL